MSRKLLTIWANFVSIILIPLLIPTYLCGFILYYYPTLITTISQTEQWYILAGIFIFTVFLPFLFVFILFKLKIISSLSLNVREDRFYPQIFSCLSYLLITWYLINKLNVLNILSLAMVANSVSLLTITIITRFWKISTHTSGVMGFLSILSMIYFKHPTSAFLIPYLIILFLCINVFFARIYLKAHTVMQVVMGSCLGILLGVSVFYFLK